MQSTEHVGALVAHAEAIDFTSIKLDLIYALEEYPYVFGANHSETKWQKGLHIPLLFLLGNNSQ